MGDSKITRYKNKQELVNIDKNRLLKIVIIAENII